MVERKIKTGKPYWKALYLGHKKHKYIIWFPVSPFFLHQAIDLLFLFVFHIPIISPWNPHEIPMKSSWNPHEIPMKSPWKVSQCFSRLLPFGASPQGRNGCYVAGHAMSRGSQAKMACRQDMEASKWGFFGMFLLGYVYNLHYNYNLII